MPWYTYLMIPFAAVGTFFLLLIVIDQAPDWRRDFRRWRKLRQEVKEEAKHRFDHKVKAYYKEHGMSPDADGE